MFDVKSSIIQMTSNAPIKYRYVRANQAPFMNKKINKEIIKRSRLRYKFLNTKIEIYRKAYCKQRNPCVSLTRSDKNFFSDNNTTESTDNKTFLKTVNPFFTNKIKTKSKITLIEKKVVSQEDQEEIVSEKIILNDLAVEEIFKTFFINIVSNSKIFTDHGYDNDFIATDDQVTNAVNKFRNHHEDIILNRSNNSVFLRLKIY